MAFDPRQPRDKNGRWYDTISMGDLSTPDARRSPEVTPEGFQAYAVRGHAKYDALKSGATEPKALTGTKWAALKDTAYAKSREPWGGDTIDAHTGESVPDGANAYALTVREPGMESVHVKPTASRAEFDASMEEAKDRYAQILAQPGVHLGVFHDEDTNSIDIDPVLVTPSLDDVHDIGAYTHAVGGAYHFQSGDGFWPPHVLETDPSTQRDLDYVGSAIPSAGLPPAAEDEYRQAGTDPNALQQWLTTYGGQLSSDLYSAIQGAIDGLRKDKKMDLSIYTPSLAGQYDLAVHEGSIAFWKQVLPQKEIHYTAKDGTRQTLAFTSDYLTDLSVNKAVDKVPFLLADASNSHTMDPERFRGDVVEWAIREGHENPDHDGLYGKIVFPNTESAKAVLDNPDLGVSARIREGIEKSDGSQINRGIIHVLGTLDPQVSGMSGWQTADLSNAGDTLDLTDETYEDGNIMAAKKSVTEYTEVEIEAMSEEELDVFLLAAEAEFEGILDEDEDDDLDTEDEDEEQHVEEGQLVSLSNTDRAEIDLANSRANRALSELAQARWEKTRDGYLNAGVPPYLLDLTAPIFNRPSDFVVDLSNEVGAEDEIHVGEIVSKLLDAVKGTVDLSAPVGHGGVFKHGDGEDPDAAALDLWNNQG